MGCGVFVVAFTSACIVVFICQCRPIHAFWTTLAGALTDKLGGHCIEIRVFLLTVGSINAATDFVILLLVRTISHRQICSWLTANLVRKPMPILWHLKTGNLQKAILTGIFVMGMT